MTLLEFIHEHIAFSFAVIFFVLLAIVIIAENYFESKGEKDESN